MYFKNQFVFTIILPKRLQSSADFKCRLSKHRIIMGCNQGIARYRMPLQRFQFRVYLTALPHHSENNFSTVPPFTEFYKLYRKSMDIQSFQLKNLYQYTIIRDMKYTNLCIYILRLFKHDKFVSSSHDDLQNARDICVYLKTNNILVPYFVLIHTSIPCILITVPEMSVFQ